MTRKDIETVLNESLRMLRANDGVLLELGASERCLTHRLAVHLAHVLQQHEPRWDVDCEYNRDGEDPKTVKILSQHTNGDVRRRVYPDIVVHRRGRAGAENNLLIVEAKKGDSRKSLRDYDIKKLAEYRRELSYRFTAFVTFPDRVEVDPDRSEAMSR